MYLRSSELTLIFFYFNSKNDSVCDIMAIFMRHLRHLAHLIHVVAQIVFYSTIGCMAAQVNYEIDTRRINLSVYESLPTGEIITDRTVYEESELSKEKSSHVI